MSALDSRIEAIYLEMLRTTIEYELVVNFYEYSDMVQLDIELVGNRYRCRCRFTGVPQEVQSEIQSLVDEIVQTKNDELIKEEQDAAIQRRERHQKERSETYDVIVILDMHGCHPMVESESGSHCGVLPLPDDKYVTLLQGAPCGVVNFSDRNWHIFARQIYDAGYPAYGPTKELALFLQIELRKRKQANIKNKKSSISQTMTSMLKGNKEDKELAQGFLRTKGWDIITSNRMYAQRNYVFDKQFPLSAIVVFSSIRDITEGTNLKMVLGSEFTREELLNYLYSQGATHPLIIDDSCGEVYASSETSKRAAAREIRISGLGGRKTRRKTRKSRRNLFM